MCIRDRHGTNELLALLNIEHFVLKYSFMNILKVYLWNKTLLYQLAFSFHYYHSICSLFALYRYFSLAFYFFTFPDHLSSFLLSVVSYVYFIANCCLSSLFLIASFLDLFQKCTLLPNCNRTDCTKSFVCSLYSLSLIHI